MFDELKETFGKHRTNLYLMRDLINSSSLEEECKSTTYSYIMGRIDEATYVLKQLNVIEELIKRRMLKK